jgi:hypothetical protein
MSWGRVALDYILLHDSSVHEDSSVKDTLDLANSKVDKVLSDNCDLSVSMFRAANRFDGSNRRLIVVQKGDSSRTPKTFFKRN